MKQFIAMIGEGLESSSCSKAPEFLAAYKIFKKEFTKILKDKDCTDIQIGKGHFYVSGFFTASTGQIWYFSLEDFRDPAEYMRMLYRTATSYTDFSGGSNKHARLDNLAQELNITFVDKYQTA